MEILLRVGAAGRLVDFGLATTRAERARVLAQRCRVYRRQGYLRPGLRAERDAWDRTAVYFLATVSRGESPDTLLGSARLVPGEPRPGFRFPVEAALRLELPAAVREIPLPQRAEVGRLVAERPQGLSVGGLLTPLGLMHAIATYARRRGLRCGLASLKLRLLRALRGAGVRLHELPHRGIAYPPDGPVAGYFHRHPDPVVPVYFLGEEIGPSLVEALARYQAPGE